MAKVVTIRDVAKAAGVSPMTVSRVLNNRPDVSPQTRKHVQNVIDNLGYSPSTIARSLSHGRTNMLGVVTSGLAFYGPSRTLTGIEREANRLGYSVMIRLLHNPLASRGEREFNDLIANQVAGIIWALAEIGERRDWLYERLDNDIVPIVLLSTQPRQDRSIVVVDNRLGGRLAAGHLLDQGYRRVGIIAGPLTWWEARERALGWREALLAAGLTDVDLREEGDWTSASGYAAMYRLLDRAPELEAVFVCNDSMALGAIQAAEAHGRSIPGELALVGFDDIPESAYFSPALTTIRQDLLEMGCRSVQMLHEQLQALKDQRTITTRVSIVEPQLIVRRSSLVGA